MDPACLISVVQAASGVMMCRYILSTFWCTYFNTTVYLSTVVTTSILLPPQCNCLVTAASNRITHSVTELK